MKNTKLFICLLCCLYIGLSPANGKNPRAIFQGNPHDKFGSNSLSYSFFPLFYNGFAIEYDRLLTPHTGRHWLKIAPTYYTSINYSTMRKSDIENLRGFGVNLYHRYNYYEIEKAGFQLYFQWGLGYNKFKILANNKISTNIDKLSLDIMLGFRQIIAGPLFFDFVVGYGNRFILNHTNSGEVHDPINNTIQKASNYDGSIFDYGYGGPSLNINITIGFVF